MRTPTHYTAITLTTLALVSGVAACSASDRGDDDADLGSASQAVTAKGKAPEGATCLVTPIYRTDKCLPGLTCATSGGSAIKGVCVGPHKEAEPCDPTFGSVGCAGGLSCTATPGSATSGFCRGAGTGACRTANAGADCATGRVCVESAPGSGSGTCQSSGTEGTPCDDSLVNNQCQAGFECVVPPGRGNLGICTNPAQGGIGAPCGTGQPRQELCVTGTLCALAPELVGRHYEATSVTYRCAAPAAVGEQCVGVYSAVSGNLGGMTACQYKPCYPRDPSHTLDGSYAVGVCSNPIMTTGATCGTHGVDDCGSSPNPQSNYYRLMCIDGSCVQTNVGAQQACTVGRSPSGQGVNNCGWGYNAKQMACTNGKCVLNIY